MPVDPTDEDDLLCAGSGSIDDDGDSVNYSYSWRVMLSIVDMLCLMTTVDEDSHSAAMGLQQPALTLGQPLSVNELGQLSNHTNDW